MAIAVQACAHTPTIINNLLAPDLSAENVHDEIFQFCFMGQKVYIFFGLSSHVDLSRYAIYHVFNVRAK